MARLLVRKYCVELKRAIRFHLFLPEGAEISSIRVKSSPVSKHLSEGETVIWIWALIDLSNPEEERDFLLVKTDQVVIPVDLNLDNTSIRGTFVESEDTPAFHLLEIKKD